MWLSKHIGRPFLCLLLLLLTTGCSAAPLQGLQGRVYVIAHDEHHQKWAAYLYQHLRSRTDDSSSIVLNTKAVKAATPGDERRITFKVDEGLAYDYVIDHAKQSLNIQVRDDRTALWMVYQLIENIAVVDNRFVAADLPPATIDMEPKKVTFDFQYREPFWQPNLEAYYAPISGTNNIETDWGIWGHNLSKALAAFNGEDIYALINHKKNHNQFCFSSPELLRQLTGYILDNYGDGERQQYRFMLMPEDNNLVCTDDRCTEKGNMPGNATPAVSALVTSLSKRFPKHQFFMTAYKTTSVPPTAMLPDNVGVFISTIDLPKGITLEKKQSSVRIFLHNVAAWKACTPHIYLWDYAANFDDYLSPLPMLTGLQKQLQFFKSLGIQGIFLNASGYDYTPFQGVRTFVSGALMMDVHADINQLVERYFLKEYPVSHELLSHYYLSAEASFTQTNKPYDIYGGIRDELASYIEASSFIAFYDALGKIIPTTFGEEQQKLRKLYTALSFTRLQIAYARGYEEGGYAIQDTEALVVKPEIQDFMNVLEGYKRYSDMQRYKETGGELSAYLSEWKSLCLQKRYESLLMNRPVQVLSLTDEGFETPQLLHDGTPGFENDYHQGWYLSSRDHLVVRFETKEMKQAKEIRLRFLNDPKHGIYPPEKVELSMDGKRRNVPQLALKGKVAVYNIKADFTASEEMTLTCVRKKAAKSIIACDEIQVCK